jgi:amidase
MKRQFVLIMMFAAMGCGDEFPEQVLPPGACSVESGPDTDGDGTIDECDTCPELANPDQADADHDGVGDLCSDDDDGDLILDVDDNCPLIFNRLQWDTDEDSLGDMCDPTPAGDVDTDGDGVVDSLDDCPLVADPEQKDTDDDGVGDLCDSCPNAVNGNQWDLDQDGIGDACDSDIPFTVEGAGISALHIAMSAGQVTCEEVTSHYLERMWAYDLDTRRGGVMNALIEVNTKALDRARDIDLAFATSGELSGRLHCVPFIVKANYGTTDLAVSSGTVGMTDTIAKTDGFAVARMKEAGAIVLSTANMDELAFGVFGISSDGGRTGNAFNPSYNSGGSSAGSAAAVASSFAAFSMGSDNCASLTLPAALHGLVTMRSTTGLVSTKGVFPSNSLDAVIGPMTVSVADMATVLDVIVKPDADARTQNQGQATREQTYVSHLKPDGLRGKRIGIARWMGSEGEPGQFRFMFEGGSAAVQGVFHQVFLELEDRGATVVDNISFPSLSTNRWSSGGFAEAQAFLANTTGPVNTLEEFCRTGGFSKWVHTSVDACLNAVESGRLKDPDANSEKYVWNRDYAEKVMDRLDLDILVYPVDGLGSAQPTSKQPNCYISSVTGLPSITVVGGVHPTTKMPIGLMFTARAFDEDTLIEAAYSWEQSTKRRPLPNLGTDVAPALDVEQMNSMHQTISRSGFDEVLKDGGKFDLSAGKYLELTKRHLEAINASWLLPE